MKGKQGETEEQVGIKKDVEKNEDNKNSFVTENNEHKTNDYNNEDSVNEENSKIQEHKEYKNYEMCIGQEVNIL